MTEKEIKIVYWQMENSRMQLIRHSSDPSTIRLKAIDDYGSVLYVHLTLEEVSELSRLLAEAATFAQGEG